MSAETTPNISLPSRVVDSSMEALFDSPARNTRSSKKKKTSTVAASPDSSHSKSSSKGRPKIPTTSNGEVDLSKVKMKDLIRGGQFGKPMKSSTEKLVIFFKVIYHQSGDPEETVISAPSPKEPSTPKQKEVVFAPQVRIVDGQIVVNEESLVVTADSSANVSHEDYNVVVETGNHVTSHSFLTNRTTTEKWSTEETELFYKALQQYGTDFSIIENLFPTKDRRQIKNKFKKEERDHPQRIAQALTKRLPINLDEYKKLSVVKIAKLEEKEKERKEKEYLPPPKKRDREAVPSPKEKEKGSSQPRSPNETVIDPIVETEETEKKTKTTKQKRQVVIEESGPPNPEAQMPQEDEEDDEDDEDDESELRANKFIRSRPQQMEDDYD